MITAQSYQLAYPRCVTFITFQWIMMKLMQAY